GFVSTLGQYLVTMLHKSAVLQFVIERSASACQIDNLDHVLQLPGIFFICGLHHLPHSQTGSGAAFHAERLDALKFLRSSHRRNGILREAPRSWSGRACSEGEKCERNKCESIPK